MAGFTTFLWGCNFLGVEQKAGKKGKQILFFKRLTTRVLAVFGEIYIMIMSLPVITVVSSMQHQCKHLQNIWIVFDYIDNILIGTQTGLKDKIIDRKPGKLRQAQTTFWTDLITIEFWQQKFPFVFTHCCIGCTVTNVENLVWYRSYLSTFKPSPPRLLQSFPPNLSDTSSKTGLRLTSLQF